MHGDHSKPIFGPTWANKPRGSSPIDGVDSKEANGKGTVNYNGKKVPLMFARSRSSPILPVEEDQVPSKKTEEDFSILHSFESDFPSLGALSKGNVSGAQALSRSMPQPSKPSSDGNNNNSNSNSAWKSGQNKASPMNPLSVTLPQSTTANSQGNSAITEAEFQLASCVVPTVQAVPKILAKNKVELLKKGPPRKKMEKAPSDTCLPIPAAYQEKYAKMKADKQQKSGTVVLNRSDFFKGKSEDNSGHRRGSSVDSGNAFGQTPVPSPIFGGSGQVQGNVKAEGKAIELEQSNNDLPMESDRSSALRDEEEKFLRGLGWRPEEEDHVPELSPDEIVTKNPKLNRLHHDQYKKTLQSSFHVSIKKWQTDRLFGPQDN